MKAPFSLVALCLIVGASAADASAQGTSASKFPGKRPKTPSTVPTIVTPAQPQSGGSIAVTTNGSDDCATPKGISGDGTFSFDTTASTTGVAGQGNCECFGFGSDALEDDVWYVWTAGATGQATASMCFGASHDAKLAVHAGASCPTGSPLVCDDDYCAFAGPSQVSWNVTNGSQYMIQIGNYGSGAGGTGTFSITTIVPPPSNDDCSSPTGISGPGPHNFDTTLATTGPQGQCNSICTNAGSMAIANDAWWTWTAGFNGPARISLCAGGNGNDTKVAVYAGAGCPTGSALGCDDDFCGVALESQTTFTAVFGNQYTVQLGNYPSAAGGTGFFTIDPFTPPAGDDCANPIVISGNGPFNFDTSSATTGAEGQNEALCLTFGSTAVSSDVWYVWNAPCTGTVTVSMCAGSFHDSKLAVYLGAGCPTASAITCDDDVCFFAGPSEIVFSATAGNDYTIQLGSFGTAPGGAGSFTIAGCPGGVGSPFCFGFNNGSCPCVAGTNPGGGCGNESTGDGGAVLGANLLSGTSPSVSDDGDGSAQVELSVTLAQPNKPSLFIQGDATISPVVFYDGLRCVGGTLVRLNQQPPPAGDFTDGSGSLVYPNAVHTQSVVTRCLNLGQPISSGDTRHYFMHHRVDPTPNNCIVSLSGNANTSNGLTIAWGP